MFGEPPCLGETEVSQKKEALLILPSRQRSNTQKFQKLLKAPGFPRSLHMTPFLQ